MKILKRAGMVLGMICLLLRPLPASAQTDGAVQMNGSVQAGEAARLMIDNENLYEGMDKTYSEGYVPKVTDGTAHLVMPLISTVKLKNDTLRVALDLGDTGSMPFVCKNYVKSVPLQQVKINDGKETAECYLVSFDLELKEDRQNGSYPVILSAKATDEDGNAADRKFTIYVTITDGKNPDQSASGNAGQNGNDPAMDLGTDPTADAGGTDPMSAGQGSDTQASGSAEAPNFAPKLIVQTCSFSKETIYAGDEVQIEITLVNTSQSDTIRNLTAVISGQGEYFGLLSQSDTLYIDSVSPGKTLVISYRYKVSAAAPQGQYGLELALDYADSEGTTYTSAGKVLVSVEQQMKVQFDPLVINSEVQVADVVEAKVQAMNLGRGKVYNVRAVLEADGLVPQGTIFIGDMEAGTTASGSTQVSVTSLGQGGAMYGATEGTVTFYYEDEAGKEFEETAVFSTTITSPFSESAEEAVDETGQWWTAMAVTAIVLCAFLLFMSVRVIRRRKQQDEMVE